MEVNTALTCEKWGLKALKRAEVEGSAASYKTSTIFRKLEAMRISKNLNSNKKIHHKSLNTTR